MMNFRRMGPRGLDAWVHTRGSAPSRELDQLCAQKDAHTALLYWFTDLGAAVAEARRVQKPILSLRLLGRLDEELSCANSRFFRKLLYPEPRINRALREQFVLHWHSVRPVPRVTIDFGDGRRVERTLTGNSAHLVLDAHGRVADAIPGLLAPEAFLAELTQGHAFARADRRDLAQLHARAVDRPAISELPAPSGALDLEFPAAVGADLPARLRAMMASGLARAKHRIEAPLLRAVATDLDDDTAQNLELHTRIHAAFASGDEWRGLDGFVEWLYADIFQMPLDDAALGLDVPDPFPLAVAQA